VGVLSRVAGQRGETVSRRSGCCPASTHPVQQTRSSRNSTHRFARGPRFSSCLPCRKRLSIDCAFSSLRAILVALCLLLLLGRGRCAGQRRRHGGLTRRRLLLSRVPRTECAACCCRAHNKAPATAAGCDGAGLLAQARAQPVLP
jgi:hypothetical protein